MVHSYEVYYMVHSYEVWGAIRFVHTESGMGAGAGKGGWRLASNEDRVSAWEDDALPELAMLVTQ